MEIHSLASGSSGNAYIIKEGKQSILLDAGLSGKRILAGIAASGINPSCIVAVLITHEHNDHIAGAGIVSRRLNLPLYMTPGTWKTAEKRLGRINEGNMHLINPCIPFHLGSLEITAMKICHDAVEPVTYVFDTGRHRAVVLTDTGCITQRMLEILATCHAMVLEANHDPEMLRTGPYPWPLKQRVAGRLGHLSNLQAAQAVEWLVKNGRIQRIHLGHLSAINNCPDHALSSVAKYLAEKGLGSESVSNHLKVLPRQQNGPVLQVK